MLEEIAVENVKKHRVNCVIILNNSFSDVMKPLVSELRSRYLLFATTYCIGYLLNYLIKIDLFLHLWLCFLDNINKSDIGSVEEVVRSFLFRNNSITHTYIYQLKVVSHYLWIFFSNINNFFNITFLLYMD